MTTFKVTYPGPGWTPGEFKNWVKVQAFDGVAAKAEIAYRLGFNRMPEGTVATRVKGA